MEAYRIKGKIDSSGNLVIIEPINLPPGDVEMVIWQTPEILNNTIVSRSESVREKPKRASRVKAFEGLFEKAPAIPVDFDPEQAKWEYLKEKYNL